MIETPIYDRLKRESDARQMIALDTQYFRLQAEDHPVRPFNIEVDDFEKMTTSIFGVLYTSLAEVQPNVHETFEDSADIFNSGFEAAIETLHSLFAATSFEEAKS